MPADSRPSKLSPARSITGTGVAAPAIGPVATVSLSVALLLAGVGSVMPAGAAMVAVLDSVPVAVEATVAFTVYVTLAPMGRFTVSLMLPLPDAVQVPPPEAVQVQVALVRAAGNVSVTVAPVTPAGPALLAVTV